MTRSLVAEAVPERASEQSPWRDRFSPILKGEALEALRARNAAVVDHGLGGEEVGIDLCLSGASLEDLLADLDAASARGEEWLLHPAARALWGWPRADPHARLLLFAWAGQHTRPLDGLAILSSELRLWTPQGVHLLPPGPYELGALSELMAAPPTEAWVPLDVAWDSLGPVGPRHASIPAEWRSAPLEHLASDERRTMFADLRAYWTANGVLEAYLPDVAAWLGEVMRLCLPIRRRPDAKFKSASRADLPGVVFCDLGVSWSLILEGLVHETSHLRLFLEEHAGPLIPADHHATYRSPLRPEPRPLRGLLLAYHALAHMAALYRDLETAVPTAPISQDANTIRVKLAESRAVILAARGHLTPRGADFVERTERVCSHAL